MDGLDGSWTLPDPSWTGLSSGLARTVGDSLGGSAQAETFSDVHVVRRGIMTARSHETIRVGLRRIIRDQSVRPNVRMQAIELLLRVEGLMDEAGHLASSKDMPACHPVGERNISELRELLDEMREQDSA